MYFSHAQSAFKMYLTMSPSITNWSTSGDEFSLVFDSNPLTEFVELPDSYSTMLKYCNIIPGIIRGALEMVRYTSIIIMMILIISLIM